MAKVATNSTTRSPFRKLKYAGIVKVIEYFPDFSDLTFSERCTEVVNAYISLSRRISMGETLAEKIVGAHTETSAKAGESVIASVDYAFTHDASGPLVIDQLKALGSEKVFDPSRVIVFIDHAVPSPRRENSNDQNLLKAWADSLGVNFHRAGTGICHQVLAERYASPNNLIVGTDSHSVMAGALASFATGMGATDVAVSMSLGKTWIRVPETFRFILGGTLSQGVYPKDVILHIIALLGGDGATYKSMEFSGSGVDRMLMHERLTLSNMVVEAGAKVGLIASDRNTRKYLESRGREDEFVELRPDEDANYEKTFDIAASDLSPMVSFPHSVDNVRRIEEIGEVKINEVFVGSCTNARLEDLQIVASILKGKEVNSNVRLVVTPASGETYANAIKDGTISTLLDAGAIVTPSGCGACFGALGGIPADNEAIFTTTNRNFVGRTGNPSASTYLGSPATAAATALAGEIADPREVV